MIHDITEYLTQLQELTTRNLEILKVLNDSFYTKKNHLVATVDDVDYVIPSFISLENKIDSLQQNLENIVNAPTTGEAFTYFDGTTQKLELMGYSTAPLQLSLEPATSFSAKTNSIFKDFMNPMPFVKMDISSISNNTKDVLVKKVCIKNNDLNVRVSEVVDESGKIRWEDLYKILYLYKKDIDYIEYDTQQSIPYRTCPSDDIYTINKIINNWTDSDFVDFYTVELNEDLVYHVDNGTIQYELGVGDKFVTKNNKVQLEIVELFPNTHTVTLKVLYGAYANLVDVNSNNDDMYSLRFYAPANFDETKYIEVPLEEDRYVCVFIAPINTTTNTRSSWGQGIYMDVDSLTMDDGTPFRTYYNEQVNNIGDTLFDITQMLNSSLTNLTPTEWQSVTSSKPIIDATNITVTQINKHLNDSDTIQQIRSLYDQKNAYKSELTTTQRSIDNINNILSNLSFDDTTNSRSLYTSQLNELNATRINLTQSIQSISEEIAASANAADVPIENAKYHIRGFVECPSMTVGDIDVNVIKLDVEYRYKNANKFTGNAETIGEDYIYSDWNKMESFYRHKRPSNEDGKYKFEYEDDNSSYNEPSFNQIDIPISQGENVDIRVRFVYDLGYPFVETLSDWSDIYNMSFPEEYITNVTIVSIIDENNEDLQNNYFSSTLNKIGVTSHCDDKLEDQNITYFHKPEHISSGFYTAERRVIPLFDKLTSLTEDIEDLKTEVLGQQSDNLVLYISDDQNSSQLQPYVLNKFFTVDYKNNENKILADADEDSIAKALGKDVAYMQLNLNIYNAGNYNMKLYSMFPGSINTPLTSDVPSKYNAQEYYVDNVDDNYRGVYVEVNSSDSEEQIVSQTCNQYIYFRTKDMFTNEDYYFSGSGNPTVNDTLLSSNKGVISDLVTSTNINDYYQGSLGTGTFGSLYPYLGDITDICIPTKDLYIIIKPGESISIPLSFFYTFGSESPLARVSKTIGFDIKTSLYKDPVTYRLQVIANWDDTKPFKTRKIDGSLKIANSNAPTIYSPIIHKKTNL